MIQAALLLLPLLSFQPIAFQDPPPDVPDKRPEVAEALAMLKAHAGKEGKEDKDAIAVIDQLLQEFPNSGPKDKMAIVKGLSKCFEERRLEKEGEAPQNQLYIASAAALGQMGPESTEVLISWIGHKAHKKDVAVQQRLILSLGQTKSKKAVKELINGLNHPTPTLVSAAAEALGQFEGSDLETRKTGFEALLKVLTAAKAQKDANVQDGIARERYDVIAAPIITSLSKLSKHDERDPEKWQTWWNKNKRADWDAEQ